jgi:hydroxypyruvate isomerase
MPPDQLLFRALAGPHRADHVRFAARQGMGGILFPWAQDRPPEERAAVREALRDTGLACSCIVTTPLATFLEPMWVTAGAEAEEVVSSRVEQALAVALELGSSTLAVLIRSDGSTAPAVQRRRAADRLRKMADHVAPRGVVLAIEPMIEAPDMLLRTFAEGVDLVREISHPHVKLIFDTGHLTRMGDPLVESYIEAYDDIALLQLADMPGRVEPGAGTLSLVEILAHALRRGYRGLVDLEHGWSRPGEEAESRGLELLHRMDVDARKRAGIES